MHQTMEIHRQWKYTNDGNTQDNGNKYKRMEIHRQWKHRAQE